MTAFMRVVSFAAVSVAACLAACGDDDTAATADGGADAPVGPPDSSLTDTGAVDSGVDAELDAGPDSPPPPPPPLGPRDRAGRPYLAYLLSAANREAYNMIPGAAATDPPGAPSSFGADLQSSLTALDALDGTNDWNGGGADAGPNDAGVFPHPLVNAWIGVDAHVVDPNKPFSANGYLEVETQGNAHATSGGRWLTEDALDITFSYAVKKQLSGVSDGVNAPGKAPSLQFPYFASPY